MKKLLLKYLTKVVDIIGNAFYTLVKNFYKISLQK